jgi:putative chitinase
LLQKKNQDYQSDRIAGGPMQNMRCIAIGVSDAPPLEYLQGAENCAKAFGAWASRSGIPTEILTDQQQPVGFDSVKAAFGRLFAGKPNISRLLIFFAGHGLARDAAEDLWLLSQWSTTQRAVAVGGLSRRLMRYGVEQLTIISDACRSPAAGADSADLVADPVLDMGPFDARMPLIDMLRASSPFHAAYMIRGSRPEEDRCIFSGLLNEALSGAHEKAFEAPDRLRISNFSLADFLTLEVPVRAGLYQVQLRPDITTGLRPPDNIYVGSRPAAPPALVPWPAPGSVGAMSAAASGPATRRGWSTASMESLAGTTGRQMIPVDSQTMREIAPRFSGVWADRQAKIIAEVGEVLRPTLESYDITTRLRIAHFLGQTCEESAGFRTTEEFASGRAYEGRKDLGNTQPGDGPRYKGRGLLQLIGRANYREYGQALGIDLEADPTLAAQPSVSLKIACEYWKRRNINAACDDDDLLRVTRAVSGGLNGLPDRRGFTSKAKEAVARLQGIQLSGAPADGESKPFMQRGSKGDAVTQLQEALRDLNFAVAVDGAFGPGTEAAVSRFQSEHGLAADGIVGPATSVALWRQQQEKNVQRYLKNYDEEGARPTHFETGSGFNIAGGEAAQATLGRFATAARDQNPSWWRVEPVGSGRLTAPAPLLIEFEHGNWGGAAALPNHVATFTLEGESVVSVIYRWVWASPTQSRETEVAIAQLRAGVVSAEAGYDLAARLRDEKAQDPVQAVIAAYIYDSLGDVDNVRRIAFYLALAGVPVPYDVALLGHLTARRAAAGPIEVEIPETPARTPRSPEERSRRWTVVATASSRAPVAGIFPWLRQGWLLLEDEDPSDLVIGGLAELRAELLASPFTTLTDRGGRRLSAMIEEA